MLPSEFEGIFMICKQNSILDATMFRCHSQPNEDSKRPTYYFTLHKILITEIACVFSRATWCKMGYWGKKVYPLYFSQKVHPSILPSNGPTAHIGPWPPLLRFHNSSFFYGVGLLAPRLTPNLEGQVSVFMTPGDTVAQLYLRALGSSGTSRVPLHVPTTAGPS
jgi:hypothetical protein